MLPGGPNLSLARSVKVSKVERYVGMEGKKDEATATHAVRRVGQG